MNRPRLLVLAFAFLLACRDDRHGATTDEDPVPSSAVTRLVSVLPLRDRLAARPAALDHLRYERAWDRHVGNVDPDPRGMLDEQVDETFAELERLPAGLRLGGPRAITYRSALSYLSTAAQFLAYRRVALTHPSLPATLPAEDLDRWHFDRAPRVDGDELIRRADKLEIELGQVVEKYRPHITPYMECMDNFEERVLVIRTLLANARGDLTINTGTLHLLLRTHGIPTQGLTPWDQGLTVFKGGECPEPP